MAELRKAPELTMPAAEAEALGAAYGQARVILEYGSGGSTLVAAGLAGRTVFSVESDAAWLRGMEGWFAAHPPRADIRLHHADIGPTGRWGHPEGTAHCRHWPRYPAGVWEREDFVAPDVVLIDGRFRMACLLTVAFRTTRPVTVLFDDYGPRRHYHRVESFVPRRPELVGRMAVFDVTPTAIPLERLSAVLASFMVPA